LLQGKKAQYLYTWLDKKSDLENVMLDDYRHERRKQHKRKNKGLGEMCGILRVGFAMSP
jgi:hypothetical protein